MRTTCVATRLEGGKAANALPQLAAANVNCRLRPDDTVERLIAELNKLIADDQVKITISYRQDGYPASPMNPQIMGALNRISGLMWPGDAMVVFAGETRDARRTFAWSVMLAAPIIALAYILGTGSLVSVVTPDKVDLVSPISQALTAGTRPGDLAANLIPLVIWALLLSFIASMMLIFEVATRLPMVAGWNRLLPDWFGRLHPRRRTPVNSILFVAGVALALASTIGAGKQEAFQLLANSTGLLSALTYLVMFALPLFGRQTKIERPALWLRAASISVFLMTALYVVLALFPIIDVPHPLMYGAKVGGFAIFCELIAVALYWWRNRRTEEPLTALRTEACCSTASGD
jgi:amino acid transporter